MKGYAIGGQTGPKGTPTTGGSPTHAKMKMPILKGGPKNSGATVNNKTMYKSSGYGNTSAKGGK